LWSNCGQNRVMLKPPNPGRLDLFGEPSGIRTPDTLIKSQVEGQIQGILNDLICIIIESYQGFYGVERSSMIPIRIIDHG
jgi:hypothetical protein